MTPRFRSKLVALPNDDGRTWYLYRSLVYVSAIVGVVRVPRGFETDWASIPRLFWNVLPPWGTYGKASAVHDWLYWNQFCSRSAADAVLLEAMATCKVPAWKKWPIYAAVRIFGWWAWRSNIAIAREGYSRIDGSGVRRPQWQRKPVPIPSWNLRIFHRDP